MDYNIPSHISPATLVKATRLAKNSKSLKIGSGSVFWDDTEEGKRSYDYVYFIFTNTVGDLAVIYCSPNGYLVELSTEDESVTNFTMVTNIRHFLFGIRKLGFASYKSKRDNDSRT